MTAFDTSSQRAAGALPPSPAERVSGRRKRTKDRRCSCAGPSSKSTKRGEKLAYLLPQGTFFTSQSLIMSAIWSLLLSIISMWEFPSMPMAGRFIHV